jgi:hypothetical protein
MKKRREIEIKAKIEGKMNCIDEMLRFEASRIILFSTDCSSLRHIIGADLTKLFFSVTDEESK